MSRNRFLETRKVRSRIVWLLYFAASYQWILHNKILLCKEKCKRSSYNRLTTIRKTHIESSNWSWATIRESQMQSQLKHSLSCTLPPVEGACLSADCHQQETTKDGPRSKQPLLRSDSPEVWMCQHHKLTLFRVRTGEDLTSFVYITFQNEDSHGRTCWQFYRQQMKEDESVAQSSTAITSWSCWGHKNQPVH